MSDKKTEPFFARFLEGQVKVKAGVKAGAPASGIDTTLKFPSDGEDRAHTMKYPSDEEDTGGGRGELL